jgi:hypothetical protein
VCPIYNATLTFTHKPLHTQNDKINGNIEFLQPYPILGTWHWYSHNISCFVALWVIVTDKQHLCTKILLSVVYCCLTRYFLARICIAKCFTNSSKWFQCEVIFGTEYMFCSWIHHVCSYTAFVPLAWAAARHRGSSESLLHGVGLLLISFLYHWMWLSWVAF